MASRSNKNDAYKTVGQVYRVCDMPNGYVLGFRRKPFSTPDNDNAWMTTSESVKSKQYVLVIESLNDDMAHEDLGQSYYRVIADEGFYWIHGFDLVQVDPVTGDITANTR